MSRNKAFTLIELMVVILIVSILAAVAVPIMRGRIDAAKWSEGKAMAGTLATSLRAYAAEKGGNGTWVNPTLSTLGFAAADLTGTYFNSGLYGWTSTYDSSANPALTFTITINAPGSITAPTQVTLDHLGQWAEP
ncbi:MAG: type II secretion system protein [Planctomycetes bacterium]|nr:type II secretion system protein [Planctomycetota bacterium]